MRVQNQRCEVFARGPRQETTDEVSDCENQGISTPSIRIAFSLGMLLSPHPVPVLALIQPLHRLPSTNFSFEAPHARCTRQAGYIYYDLRQQ